MSRYVHISIHTPTRGVTPLDECIREGKSISIHTPTRGVTDTKVLYHTINRISIHTPTRGVTRDRPEQAEQVIFQSTLPQGE